MGVELGLRDRGRRITSARIMRNSINSGEGKRRKTLKGIWGSKPTEFGIPCIQRSSISQ